MRSIDCGGTPRDIHAGAYTPYLHEQAFGRDMSEDLDEVRSRAAEPPDGALLRCAWSMAATAARVVGAPAPSLVDFGAGFEPTAALALAVLSEAAAGLTAPRAGESGGGDAGGYAALLLSLALASHVAPESLAAATVATLDAALGQRRRTRGRRARKATAADIMKLLG